jgi:hypothetical protein
VIRFRGVVAVNINVDVDVDSTGTLASRRGCSGASRSRQVPTALSQPPTAVL